MRTLFDIAGVEARIFILPGRPPFMTAGDLATVYATTVSAINRAVKRNADRFPEDFAFTMTEGEAEALKCQSGISTKANRALPTAFAHGGAMMLSAVLTSKTAIAVSVAVHRAFVEMERRALADAQHMLAKLRTEEMRRRPVRVQVIEGWRQGFDFEAIRLMGTASRPRLAQAARECLELGLIGTLPPGTPEPAPAPTRRAAPVDAAQPDLFGGA